MLKFGLFKNRLSPNPNNYIALVQELEIAEEEDILKEMVVPGGVTASQAAAVLMARREAIIKILESGKGIKTDFTRIKPGIKGPFMDQSDDFTPDRHRVTYNITLQKELKEIGKKLKPQKVTVTERAPSPTRFFDTASQLHNQVITPGMVGELKGRMLKVDPAYKEQGVFIILPDGAETRCENYLHNTDSKLLFYIPNEIKPGTKITLEVRSKLRQTVKHIKKGKLKVELNVI